MLWPPLEERRFEYIPVGKDQPSLAFNNIIFMLTYFRECMFLNNWGDNDIFKCFTRNIALEDAQEEVTQNSRRPTRR